jgi:hypothetical protein
MSCSAGMRVASSERGRMSAFTCGKRSGSGRCSLLPIWPAPLGPCCAGGITTVTIGSSGTRAGARDGSRPRRLEGSDRRELLEREIAKHRFPLIDLGPRPVFVFRPLRLSDDDGAHFHGEECTIREGITLRQPPDHLAGALKSIWATARRISVISRICCHGRRTRTRHSPLPAFRISSMARRAFAPPNGCAIVRKTASRPSGMISADDAAQRRGALRAHRGRGMAL